MAIAEGIASHELAMSLFNLSRSSRRLDWTDIQVEEDEKVNYTQCVFPGTSSIYIDCCTDSSYKVCTYLAVMFFIIFVAFASIFGYILNKNPWIRRHGLYINVFTFQMSVLLMRGLYYSFFGRSKNNSINSYIAFRTLPIIVSQVSMTSYLVHLVILIHRYSTHGTLQIKRRFQIKMHFVFWAVFLVYVGIWLLVWRVSVQYEALTGMDALMSVIYGLYLIIQVQLVRKLYAVLKDKMPPVAQSSQCHIFLMKLILILHLSLRIVMNSMSDSSSKEQATFEQQITWIYILFGDAITEMFSAFGMIILVTLTFKLDQSGLQYHQQSEKNDELKYRMNDSDYQEEELAQLKGNQPQQQQQNYRPPNQQQYQNQNTNNQYVQDRR